jgi:hypothetical protein
MSTLVLLLGDGTVLSLLASTGLLVKALHGAAASFARPPLVTADRRAITALPG